MPTLVITLIFSIAVLAILAWAATEIFGQRFRGVGGTAEADERVRQLTNENEQLHNQLEAVHDRLETLERIVTDKPSRLESEIDALKSLSDSRKIKQ